jgi:bifunctional DNA primase/polymerase-like protein/primase-like protein
MENDFNPMGPPAEWAAFYRRLGWTVIPVRHGDKRPLIRWEPFQRRGPATAEVDEWFRQWPDANIGIVTGAVSNLVVLDVDPAHGGDESLARLAQRHGDLPPTPEVTTGGGGHHLYFRHPGGSVRNRAGLEPGLDLRADGGYVVAPPSLHPSGRQYLWRAGRRPDQLALATAPHWLTAPGEEARGAGHPLRYWRSLVHEGVNEGERNSRIASLTGHLLWHEVDPAIVLELMLCWNAYRCRPPLPEDEVERVVESIARTHARHGRNESET